MHRHGDTCLEAAGMGTAGPPDGQRLPFHSSGARLVPGSSDLVADPRLGGPDHRPMADAALLPDPFGLRAICRAAGARERAARRRLEAAGPRRAPRARMPLVRL